MGVDKVMPSVTGTGVMPRLVNYLTVSKRCNTLRPRRSSFKPPRYLLHEARPSAQSNLDRRHVPPDMFSENVFTTAPRPMASCSWSMALTLTQLIR